MSGGISRFLVSIPQERNRVKNINPENAAILAVYPDIGPQYI
jgi:hypothetical protein